MSPVYDHYSDLAVEIERSREAIRHLPELMRSVKVGGLTVCLLTITIVLSTLVAALLGALGAIVAYKKIKMALQKRGEDPNPLNTEFKRMNLWRVE